MARFSKTKSDYDLKASFGGIGQEGTFVYETNAAKSLALWVRMTGGTAPRNLANTSVTLDYQSPPVTEQEERLQDGTKSYPVVTFVDSSGYSASAESSLLSFSSLEDGGEPTGAEDLPFSISLWFNWDGTGGEQHLFAKEGSALSEYEYKAYIESNNVYFYLRDEFHGGELQSVYVEPDIEPDRWYHVTFTYDGRGGSSAYEGMNIYVDGVLYEKTVLDSDASFHGMQPQYAGVLHIGEENDDTNEFDGKMAEFCAWGNHELSADEVKALYLATKFGSHDILSGVASVPARLQLRERDQQGGQYPLNLRVGDHDAQRSLTSLPFDDNHTISFLSNYAIGKIHFDGNFTAGQIFDLTSSLGDVKKRFKIIKADSDPGTLVEDSDILIPLLTPGEETTVITEDLYRKRAAKRLVDAIRNETGLKIDAKYSPTVVEKFDSSGNPLEERSIRNTLVLTHRRPGTGSYDQGNIITSKKYNPLVGSTVRSTFANVEQFSIGTTAELTLGTLSALDGDDSTIVSTGHSSPTITANGSLVPGITDANYTPLTNYVISPFDDSRIPAFEFDSFDNEGTPSSIIDGFGSKLSSKTILKISCKSSNQDGDLIFYASGAVGDTPLGTYTPEVQGKIGSGFAYWNSVLKQWEMKGLDDAHEEISPFAASVENRSQAALGFTLNPSASETGGQGITRQGLSTTNSQEFQSFVDAYKATSLPTDTYGFPNGEQYNATGSQEILMSNHISSPFLLEKMKVEIKGVFGVATSSLNGKGQYPTNKTFFVLNQRTSGDNSHVLGTRINNQRQTNAAGNDFESVSHTIETLGNREIVTWGKIGFVASDNRMFESTDPSVIDSLDQLNQDYDVIEKFEKSATNPAHTSSLNLNLHPKLGLSSDFIMASSYIDEDGIVRPIVQDSDLGGADLEGNASGRQIASSIGSVTLTGTGSFVYYGERLKEKRAHYKTSPYLLLPQDRLVFGWQNLMSIELDGLKPGFTSQAQGDLLVDKIQEVNVTLFGSLIKNSKEFHDTVNQNLSTSEIHEAIFAQPVIDQFDVEPLSVLSGSTSDALFFGSMILATSGARGRRASIAKGEAGSTGSLQRNIAFKGGGIYQDSLAPHIEFFLSNSRFFTSSAGSRSGADDTVRVGNNSYRSVVLSNNPVSSSFKLLKALGFHQQKTPTGRTFLDNRRISPASNFLASPGGGLVTKASFLSFDTSTTGSASYKIFSGTNTFIQGVTSFGSPEIATAGSRTPTTLLRSREQKIAISSIFLAAPVVSMFGNITWPVTNAGSEGLTPQIRGARYGFMNPSPLSPKNYFRRSSYGQFRDLMDQAPETAVVGLVDLNKGEKDLEAADGPVRVRFFARNGDADIDPLDTNSQNLSRFATSSLPYFDGQFRERDVTNFPPPDDTDFLRIEEITLTSRDGSA